MITADLHSHTSISHGTATVREMYEAACASGLEYFGFSEHSPLPPGFHCALYTGDLAGDFPAYINEVLALKNEWRQGSPRPLLALELDWLPTRLAWMRNLAQSAPFDYALGSLHYLDGWSVGNPANWPESLAATERHARFSAYFCEMAAMAKSGIAQIASHPDFIKIRAWPDFQNWLNIPKSRDYIAFALEAIKAAGMAMEVNAAGLRWPFHEPFPGPVIMRLAKDLGLNIAFGADAHHTKHIATGFDFLADYAKSLGFEKSVIFIEKRPRLLKF